MDADLLTSRLAGLPVPQIRYFSVTGSSNDEALSWITAGAEDGCLVVADQQTKGRGRLGRRWVTTPGASLAFSLILHPTPEERQALTLLSPLGALGISQALEALPGVEPQIKWPNDVLLRRRKVAGILVEAAWTGEHLAGVVIGIGLNVSRESVPQDDQLLFPATSIEEAAGRVIDRIDLLRDILQGIFAWRSRLGDPSFHAAWEQRLAFKGEWVKIEEAAGGQPISGELVGLDPSGGLVLRNENGKEISVAVGDVHLRLLE